MTKFQWLDLNFLLFADPEIGIASPYYQVNESAGSVEVVVMATSAGLSGYVTFQTEDGNATGEQLYIPIMRFCIPWEPCIHNEARSAGSCNEVRQELASIASTTTSKDLHYHI